MKTKTIFFITLLLCCACIPACSSKNNPVEITVRGHTFSLAVHLDKAKYTEGEPVEPTATLTYLGPDDTIAISSSDPLIRFQFLLDGVPDLYQGEIQITMRTDLRKSVPTVFHFKNIFANSDSLSHMTVVPKEDDTLTLYCPAGKYTVHAIATFDILLPEGTKPEPQSITAETSFAVN